MLRTLYCGGPGGQNVTIHKTQNISDYSKARTALLVCDWMESIVCLNVSEMQLEGRLGGVELDIP